MMPVMMILALLLSAYGTMTILLAQMIVLPLFHPWFAWAVWHAAPPALFVTALWATFRLRQYRMMDAMRATQAEDPAALLARGERVPVSAPRPVSGPERFCRFLAVLSLASIPVWIALPSPLLWIASGAGVWALMRWMLRG